MRKCSIVSRNSPTINRVFFKILHRMPFPFAFICINRLLGDVAGCHRLASAMHKNINSLENHLAFRGSDVDDCKEQQTL